MGPESAVTYCRAGDSRILKWPIYQGVFWPISCARDVEILEDSHFESCLIP